MRASSRTANSIVKRLADYRRAIEEFYLEISGSDGRGNQREVPAVSGGATPLNILPAGILTLVLVVFHCSVFGFVAMGLRVSRTPFSRRGVHAWEEETKIEPTEDLSK
jgi:hypothetical protein